ncbi:MAG: hypothetical protein D3909_06330 [Candidatus Electrothrix sp. ATG1]|nr:hypothetical protein [Candidatus Electrothrix sp. ATG1]
MYRRTQDAESPELLGTRKVDIATKVLLFEKVALHTEDLLELCLLNEQAIVSIRSVEAENEQGRTELPFTSNAVLVADGLYFFTSKEPRLNIRLEESARGNAETMSSLKIELDYLIIGDTVPEHLINKLNQELAAARPALAAQREYIRRKTETRSFALKNIMERLLLFCSSRAYRVILRSGIFDREFYLREYPDVLFQDMDPLVHYCRTGWQENRKPNASFEPLEYSDSRSLPSGTHPLLHYLEEGKQGNSAEIK